MISHSRRRSFLALAMTLCAALPASAQDSGFDTDIQTGLDEIVIQPLEEGSSVGGFGAADGLSLEQLQQLPNGGFQQELADITTEIQETVVSAPAADLRALDRLTGEAEDIFLTVGETVRFGKLSVFLGDCRFPQDNPSGDAYAYLVLRADGVEAPLFSGWMVASSPALNAMDDPRYDVWPLICKTS